MKNNAVKWLYSVTGKKKWNILWLMIVQALNGASGVLYALLLRNIVDNAVDGDRSGFKLNVLYIIILVLAQVAMRAIIRWLEELSRASLENLFKQPVKSGFPMLHSLLFLTITIRSQAMEFFSFEPG